MFIRVNNKVLNERRITTIEVDRDTPNEVNYYFNDGGMEKEKFKTREEARARVKTVTETKIFLFTNNDEILINAAYVQDVRIDFLYPNKVLYVLYNGAPVRDTYANRKEAEEAIVIIKAKIEAMNCCGGDGDGDSETTGGKATLEKTIKSNVTVGGANAGTIFPEGQTFTEFAEKILRKDITPTITTSFTNSGLKEAGTTVNGSTMTLTITNLEAVTATIDEINFYAGGSLLNTQPFVDGQKTYTFRYNQNITANITLKAELVYNTSSKIDGSADITFVYASYYGVTSLSTIDNTTASSLATTFTKSLKNTKALTWGNITADDERFCYMYPKTFGVLTSIKDGNGFEQISGYIKSEVSLTSPMNGNTIPYYVYLLEDTTTGEGFTQIYG